MVIVTAKKLKHGSNDKSEIREWKRKQGFEMLKKGMKKSVISKKLGVNRRTVYNWSLRLAKSEDWRDRKQPGSKSRLTKNQKEKLKEIIDSGPRTYGYDTDLWTLKRISEVISKEFNVNYNTTHIWRVLKNLGYSAQIPVAVAMEQNNDYVGEWLEKNYPEYVKEAKEKNATILFQDESGVQSRPNVRRTWSKRGKRPVMKVKERRDKISISSAVTPDGDLYFMIREESMKGNDTISFLDQLLSEIQGFLYIFWDGITIHRSRDVREYLGAHNDRLITRRIPSYSPELNPDEYVWDALKYQELPNYCPASMEELKYKVTSTLNKMKSNPEKMKRIIRGSKLPLPPLMGKN